MLKRYNIKATFKLRNTTKRRASILSYVSNGIETVTHPKIETLGYSVKIGINKVSLSSFAEAKRYPNPVELASGTLITHDSVIEVRPFRGYKFFCIYREDETAEFGFAGQLTSKKPRFSTFISLFDWVRSVLPFEMERISSEELLKMYHTEH